VSLAHYETPRRSSISAPTPEPISVRVATQVTVPTSGGPLVVGSAVAVAVAVGLAVAVAVAVAVGLAVIKCCFAKAAEANSRTSSALTVNRSKTFFIKHPFT
jgi:hypothetical protein